MLTSQHRQEALCRAYVHAIAALSGMSSSSAAPDYGVDLSLHEITVVGQRRMESGARLDIQAKATTRASVSGEHVRYDLAVRDYDALRLAQATAPRLLVVLVLPRAESDWLQQTEQELIVRQCAYWMSLRNWPPTPNRKSIRVSVPRANVFSRAALQTILERLRTRGEP